jgi:hypothetical protein
MNMQHAKRRTRENGREEKRDRTKRTMLTLAAVALVLILLVGGLLWMLISGLGDSRSGGGEDLETYLKENWSVFRLRSWDPAAGELELEYPLRFTYEQMQKYGASLDELRELPEGNLSTVNALRTAARERTGVNLPSVTVFGVTTDGMIAYTLFPDGSVQTCWDDP